MATEVYGESVKVSKISWTSDASGNASAAVHLDGEVVRVVTKPTDGPTDDYDVTILGEDGLDIMAGALANRDTTNAEAVVPSARVAHYGYVTVTVANAGNAKSGVIKIYTFGRQR